MKMDSVNPGLAAVKEKHVGLSLRQSRKTPPIQEGEVDGGETVRGRCANRKHKSCRKHLRPKTHG